MVAAFSHSPCRTACLSLVRGPLQNGGWASIRDIASAFLAQDDSQIYYYAEITKRMPEKSLDATGW